MLDKFQKFIDFLKSFDNPIDTFNPWRDSDPDYDIGEEAPKIREYNLYQYLKQREGSAKIILVAEALGFQGGHFSGLAMTSERQVMADDSMFGGKIFAGDKRRTSDPLKVKNKTLAEKGFTENTGTIVWNAMSEILKGDTYSWVNWNAFPFHPYKNGDTLSNRTPVTEERNMIPIFIERFKKLYPDADFVSVGNISYDTLSQLGISNVKVRHPANGGAGKFKLQIKEFLEDKGLI
jgi:hypothetical protein